MRTALQGLAFALVPRPTCVFYFSVAVGLVRFLTCVTRRVEGWWKGEFFCVGEDSCSSQASKEGSESILLVTTLRSLFVHSD